MKARDLWHKIGRAAWACADPGLQFHTTINDWHTCPAAGPIVASNPCSEYMFLDDTACNLASLNLLTFESTNSDPFDFEAFSHAVRLWTLVLDISVTMAQFPSKEIARRSYDYRTLGLGYANLGGLLMSSGIAYDSGQGRALCAAISAMMTAEAYFTSAQMARDLGSFDGFPAKAKAMRGVLANHAHAASGEDSGYHSLSTPPVPLDVKAFGTSTIPARIKATWERALAMGDWHGYRNAQVSAIAPTGTIGLLMDCDTTGIEPDYALVKFKRLAGGGYFKIINRAVRQACAPLDTRNPRSTTLSPTRSATPAYWALPTSITKASTTKDSPRRRSRNSRAGCTTPSTSNSFSTNGRLALSF
jgi:ribonucleoside-diphosphate reductase alpha chain